MQKIAAAIGVITWALFAGLAPESRIAAAGRESGAAPGRAQFGKFGNAVKLGTKVAARPKFTEEDEGRMAQAQGQKFDAAHKMWPDPLLETYLTGIVQKLVAVAKPRPFPYRVRVVNDASLNAFTFGGGLLYIHVGLVARLENEAQLAMVLGHEIAHVTEGHVAAGIEHAYTTQLLGDAAVTAGGAAGIPVSGQTLELAYGATMNAAISGHGRNQERDADRIGIDYMTKAGYDPREAPITFELLLAEYGDQPRLVNFFYGNHPANQERFDTLTALAKTTYAGDVASRRLIVNTEDFKRATRLAVIATGRLDYEEGRFQSAKAMFDKAVRVWQDDPIPHFYLGKIALETGAGPEAVDAAIKELEASVTADADYAPAHRDLGLAYYRKGDRAKAITSLEKYLVVDPKAKDADQIRSTIAELKRYGG
jgi:beta-barrel assembly-enhancing protease